jgi:hypothetical protein
MTGLKVAVLLSSSPERKLGWSNTGLVVKTYSICQDHLLGGRNEEGIATVHSAGKSWASVQIAKTINLILFSFLILLHLNINRYPNTVFSCS